MFGLAASDNGGPGFVNASVRTTNVRQVGVRLQSRCIGTHRHARVDTEDTIGRKEQMGTWVRQAARAIEEQLKKDKQELEMRERRKRGGITQENAKNKGLSLVEAEMGKLMHQDEQELLSVWEGWHWDDDKAGWLDPELCAKARREEVEYILPTQDVRESSQRGVLTRNWKGTPSRRSGQRPTRGSQGSLTCARDGSQRNTRHTPDPSCMRAHRRWRR